MRRRRMAQQRQGTDPVSQLGRDMLYENTLARDHNGDGIVDDFELEENIKVFAETAWGVGACRVVPSLDTTHDRLSARVTPAVSHLPASRSTTFPRDCATHPTRRRSTC